MRFVVCGADSGPNMGRAGPVRGEETSGRFRTSGSSLIIPLFVLRQFTCF